MRVIVTGSTRWTDSAALRRELAKLPQGSTVVHGDTEGVDALAGEVARELGLRVEAFAKEAEDWRQLNERMLASGADLVLAFHPELDDPGKAEGAKHMMGLARRAGVEVRGFVR